MNASDMPTIFEVGRCRPENLSVSGLSTPPGEHEPICFLVLLLQGFSQLCLASLIDPLRLANTLSGSTLFRWQIVSLDGRSVESASGIAVEVTGRLDQYQESLLLDRRQILMMFAGDGVRHHSTDSLRALLRHSVRTHIPIYALGTATWLLADAGVLDEVRCTIHWGTMAALSETFYGLAIDDALFVRDGHIVTCAGGLSAFDLAMALVEERSGAGLVRNICQHVVADRSRDGDSFQSAPPGLRFASTGRKLLSIVHIMEKHIDDPMPLEEVARRGSLSRRQMERLFAQHLSTTPRRYYLSLRLLKARQLIELTGMPVVDIAVACGFTSASHFSQCFRDHFKSLPSQLRKAPIAADGSPPASRTDAGNRKRLPVGQISGLTM
jgi:transcriptional regulator GlxA family with amidase domain